MAQGIPNNNSISSFEEFELKEPTPSIAASLYESAQYSRKWRVVIAILVGGILIALCLLGFYLNVESRRAEQLQSYSARTGQCRVRKQDCPRDFQNSTVLLIAIDSLRDDLITATDSPTLNYLRECGVTAEHLTPVYPSTTFPNLYTLVTGLYPNSHGIIGNYIFDPETKETFRKRRLGHDNILWWKGEPVWVTLKEKTVNSRTALYFWPGAEVDFNAGRPDYFFKYREGDRLEIGTKTVLEWLTLEKQERPQFLGLYIDHLDQAAKKFGVDATKTALLDIDRQINKLLTSMEEKNLTSCVDVMVVSGHGITPSTDSTNSIYIEKFSNTRQKERFVSGAVGRLSTAGANKDLKKNIIDSIRCKTDQLRVLTDDNQPVRYHYSNSPRIEDIILDTCLGCRMLSQNKGRLLQRDMAEQGYNNLEPDMQGVFIARGPSFKSEMKIKGFRNIEIYNLLTQLLHVEPSPNNGTESSLNHILQNPPPPTSFNKKAWTENIMPLLHDQSRDQIFIKQLKEEMTTTTESTTIATTASSTTPATTEVTTQAPTTQSTAATTLESTTVSQAEASVSPSTQQTTESTSVSASTDSTTASAPSTTVSSTESLQSTSANPSAEVTTSSSTSSTTTSSESPPAAALEKMEEHPMEKSESIPQESKAENKVNREAKKNETPDKSVEAVQAAPTVIVQLGENKTSANEAKENTDLGKDSSDSVGAITSESMDPSVNISSDNVDAVEHVKEITLKSETSTQLPASVIPVAGSPPETSPVVNGDENVQKIEQSPTVDLSSASSVDVSSASSPDSVTVLEEPKIDIQNTQDVGNEADVVVRKKRDTCDCISTDVLQTKSGKPAEDDHISYHCPYGKPIFAPSINYTGSHYILPHSSHVTGYIGELGTSLWTSFTLTAQTIMEVEAQMNSSVSDFDKACWLADPRLPRPTSEQCNEYLENDRYTNEKVVMKQLFPTEFERKENQEKEGFFLTNAIALYNTFANGCHQNFTQMLKDLVKESEMINVIMGPAWDRNFDGQGDDWVDIRFTTDYLIPTHVFYLVSFCTEYDVSDLRYCPLDSLEAFTVIMPNVEYVDDCFMSCREYAQYHMASLSDLQSLTNLQLFEKYNGDILRPPLLARQPLNLW